jgi:hypothetical protein
LRGSSPVLGERGGETPLRYSTSTGSGMRVAGRPPDPIRRRRAKCRTAKAGSEAAGANPSHAMVHGQTKEKILNPDQIGTEYRRRQRREQSECGRREPRVGNVVFRGIIATGMLNRRFGYGECVTQCGREGPGVRSGRARLSLTRLISPMDRPGGYDSCGLRSAWCRPGG